MGRKFKVPFMCLYIFIFCFIQLADAKPKQTSRKIAQEARSMYFYEGPLAQGIRSDDQAAITKHWVGIFNIKYDHSTPTGLRAYSTQILSLNVYSRTEGLRLYYEVGEPTYASATNGVGRPFLFAGIQKGNRDAVSTSVQDFLNGQEIRFTIGSFYFVGMLENGVNSPLRGYIFETGRNLFAGYFELFPRHDGGDSYGFPVQTQHRPCLVVESPMNTMPAQCFGPGAP